MLTNFRKYKLFELGEGNVEPFPYYEIEDEKNFIVYQFETEKFTYYVEFVHPKFVMFNEVPAWLKPFPYHIMSFRTAEGSMDLTEENVPFKVLATVLTIIKKVIQEYKLETLVIHPLGEKDEKNNRRENIYQRYLKKNLPPGWITFEEWVNSEELGHIKLIIMTDNKDLSKN
jgi:hypothetical protein